VGEHPSVNSAYVPEQERVCKLFWGRALAIDGALRRSPKALGTDMSCGVQRRAGKRVQPSLPDNCVYIRTPAIIQTRRWLLRIFALKW